MRRIYELLVFSLIIHGWIILKYEHHFKTPECKNFSRSYSQSHYNLANWDLVITDKSLVSVLSKFHITMITALKRVISPVYVQPCLSFH